MSLFFFFCILPRIVLWVCALAAPASIMQDEKLISEIGRVFGDALRELSGQNPAPVPMIGLMRDIGAPQQKLTPTEADQKSHADRTQALAAAVQSWVTQTCQLAQNQQAQLAELTTEMVKAESERYAKADDPTRQNRPLGEATPILFVQPDSVGEKFSTQMLHEIDEKILNNAQKSQLHIADTERTEFQRSAFRKYVVMLFDQELFLTAEQRQKMFEELTASPELVTVPFYSFTGQAYCLPYQSFSQIQTKIKLDCLDLQQQDRLKDLTSNNPNGNQNYVMFQSSEGVEQWAENVRLAAIMQRQIYLHAAAVRIGHLERSAKLTPEQSAYLSLASKGATTVAVAEWRESTQQTIDQMQAQMGQNQGNFAFSSQHISVDGLDSNEIWLDAIRAVNADQLVGDHCSAIRGAQANAVTALLDQELWMLPEQRASALELTEAVLPLNLLKSPYDDYARELILLAYPLHRVPEPKLKELLTEPQQAVWKQLKDFFRANQANQVLEIPMTNQGGSFQFQLAE